MERGRPHVSCGQPKYPHMFYRGQLVCFCLGWEYSLATWRWKHTEKPKSRVCLTNKVKPMPTGSCLHESVHPKRPTGTCDKVMRCVFVLERASILCTSPWYEPRKNQSTFMILPPCQGRHKIKGFHWVVQHIFVAGDFTGRQTCLYGLLHLYFSLTHSGKCRAGDSHSLISRFFCGDSRGCGWPRAGEKPFLSPSTSSFHGDLKSPLSLKSLPRFKKRKNKDVQHFSK